MLTPDTAARADASTVRDTISRARALVAAESADDMRAYFAAIDRADLATATWPNLQMGLLGSACALLVELADVAAASLDGPAPRTVPVEVTDDERTTTRAEVADNPLSPDWSVRMEVGADEYPSASTWLTPAQASALATGLTALAAEAKRRNADATRG
jgi:hypothetical protein